MDNKKTYISLVVFLVFTCLISFALFFRQQREHDIADVRSFPYALGEWKGKDLELAEKEYDILETRNLISREYTNKSGENIYLFIIYSETNRRVFHPPEVCLIGSGIEISDKKVEKFSYTKNKFLANKLYLAKKDYRGLALYCYKSGNFYTENFYLQQLHFIFNQLLGKEKGGATIRASTAIIGSEEESLAKLKDFIRQVISALEGLSI